ncbi:ABC transporter ATP-binding protein [Actinomadura algeriensis]|uniref:Iron(III) transport system ATP-binding protein n=1 Tax=Actinomadura algeriensis TaxID=1679523 RepID=A0ABR9K267_9ACTN|nr:ABC transporter ATP-binding protein [Actinomadura algeriensis]MBE1536946.1 iron(III) transport system ATP-binding protein [Actinomadura algeriensis]
MPEVKVAQLSKRFAGNTVLHDIDFTIEDGEFFTLLGPSGCGKSTTLSCIAGLERPSAGSITVGEKIFVDTAAKTFVPPEGRELGMVFQSYALWPHMTVAQNLAMPLKIRKIDKARQGVLIDDALEKVGLKDLRDRYPHQMSGGQQQRVALARALVYSPDVLLLDEPLSNLDAQLREQARAWLKRLQEELGITTVYVTHDQEEALALSDRIAVMSEGRLVQVGPPHEIYQEPATVGVASFVGRCNFLPGRLASVTGTGAEVVLDCNGQTVRTRPADLPAGSSVTVAVRPERLKVLAGGRAAEGDANVLRGEVVTGSYVGSRHEYEVRVGDRLVQVSTGRPGLTGELSLIADPEVCLLYPSDDAVPADVEALTTVTG